MKYTAATLALAAGATAHTVMSEIYIDGAPQGSGTCVRAPKEAKGAVDPVIDLGSSDMACGKDGTEGVARVCPMSGNQQLTFEYRQWPDDYSRGPLDMGHMGPCSVYLKKVEDATTDSATGDGWFKLWDEGYDEGSGKWCTQKMIGNEGRLSVTIPDSLAGGDYLVRPELLALHNIPVKDQPEYYIGCAQVFLESSGSSGPKETVSIPGYTSKSDPGNQYNAFDKPLKPYTIPGPKVYESTTSNSFFTAMTSQKQSHGLKPDNCIVTNANWCGIELPDYSDEDGCWDADKDCWDQLDKCYDTCGATGYEGCKTWEKKCKSNQSNCKSGASGPPNKGQSLDPQMDTIQCPASSNGNMDYGSSSSGSSSSSSSSSDSSKDTSSNDDSSNDESPSSYSAPSPDSYKQKGKTSNNNNSGSKKDYKPEPYQPEPKSTTPHPDYKPAPAKAQATTMVTKASSADNVVYETQYATVYAYETVTDTVQATQAPQAYRRHAHPRHPHH